MHLVKRLAVADPDAGLPAAQMPLEIFDRTFI